VEGAERRRLRRPSLPRLHVCQLDLPLIAVRRLPTSISVVCTLPISFVIPEDNHAVQLSILVIVCTGPVVCVCLSSPRPDLCVSCDAKPSWISRLVRSRLICSDLSTYLVDHVICFLNGTAAWASCELVDLSTVCMFFREILLTWSLLGFRRFVNSGEVVLPAILERDAGGCISTLCWGFKAVYHKMNIRFRAEGHLLNRGHVSLSYWFLKIRMSSELEINTRKSSK
jgi:hypothetical protein